MGSEFCSAKMRHAIQAGEGRALALAVMSIDLLFSENVSTGLQ